MWEEGIWTYRESERNAGGSVVGGVGGQQWGRVFGDARGPPDDRLANGSCEGTQKPAWILEEAGGQWVGWGQRGANSAAPEVMCVCFGAAEEGGGEGRRN